MKKRFFIFLLIIFSFLTIQKLKSQKAYVSGGGWSGDFFIYGKYKTDSIKEITGKGIINIFLPSNYNYSSQKFPLIIALPGWRLKANEWKSKAGIDKIAERYGYVVVLAEMWTTAYESEYFEETLNNFKWGDIPGTIWIGEVLIPFLRKAFNVDDTGKKTAIIGLSTGGRGAVYIAQKYPKIKVAISLSGDFDRIELLNWCLKNKKDIMRHDPPSLTIYGNPLKSELIKKRWTIVDNPSSDSNIENLKKHNTSVFLVHGKKDLAVPYEQSSNFYKKLLSKNIDVKYIEVENGEHNWDLWSSYLHPAFEYIKTKFDLH